MKFYLKAIGALTLLLLVVRPVWSEEPILQCDFKAMDVDQQIEKVEWHRDRKKYISPYQLQHKINQNLPQLLVADVRNPDAFKRGHLGLSFNLPHSKLISMSFYKNKEVVLVGQGQSYRQLESLHQRLTERGFKQVSILDGGVDFWKTVIESKSLVINPEAHFLIKNAVGGDTDYWQIVDTSKNPNLDQHFDNIITINNPGMLNSPESFSKRINQPNQLIKNVLLIIPENIDVQKTLKAWRAKLKANVYAMNPAKVQSALQVHEHNRRIVQYKKRRTDGAKMSCS